ncbi:MAG: methyltransferase domain-containing protein [Desulfarculaceae bacterium]|jgi:SAM-dependent methyltransferase
MGWFKTRQRGAFDWDSCSDEEFLELLYRVILGRKPDSQGFTHNLGILKEGNTRRPDLVRAFILSPECRYRCLIKYPFHELLSGYAEVADAEPFRPFVRPEPLRKVQLCELANPRKWVDQSWLAVLREMEMLSPSLDEVHRKTYEFVQSVFGLRALGALNSKSRVLGVGAGHESLLYWLANRVKEVVATDLYKGSWSKKGSREGDDAVLFDPQKYAPFAYQEDRLRFLRMDGRKLDFEAESFDVVYSLSAIEHFGGHQGAAQAVQEMGRVLRPGGVAAVATELILNQQPHAEYFLPEELCRYVVEPAGMELVQMPVFELPRYALEHPMDLPAEKEHKPHLVLRQKGVVYTSVMLFFSKA